MPDGEQSDIEDSYKVVECLDIPYSVINIGQATKALSSAIWGEVCPEFTGLAGLNIPPRIRMATLYAVAQSLSEGGRVANTCNLSETFVGYATKFGDNVGDFSPLGRLVVSEVKQIGYELDIPRELIDKVPSDGLCGKTDEENMGVTYEQIERVILEQGYEDNEVDKIILDMYARSAHKHNKMVEWCGRNNAWRNFYD